MVWAKVSTSGLTKGPWLEEGVDKSNFLLNKV